MDILMALAQVSDLPYDDVVTIRHTLDMLEDQEDWDKYMKVYEDEIYPLSNSLLTHYYSIYDDWRVVYKKQNPVHVPDYVIQKYNQELGKFVDKIVVKIKKPGGVWVGDSGALKQVNLAASWCDADTFAQEMFTICIVGLEIGFFESYDFEIPGTYANMVPLNLNNLSDRDLSGLGVDLLKHNHNTVGYKWSLTKAEHVRYIDQMFRYMKDARPIAIS